MVSAPAPGELARACEAASRRIREHVIETPLVVSTLLSRMAQARVLLKLESLQRTGSFKLRGAVNKLLRLDAAERQRGVVAASTGNHGLAVVEACRRLGCAATVYLPAGADATKLDALRERGAELVVHGSDCVEAERFARAEAEREGRVYVSPYNDLEVVAGQGTVGVEIARQLDTEPDALFASVGGGGLIAGVGSYLRSVTPSVEVVGCWPARSPVLYHCIRAGRVVDWPVEPTLSDATAGGVEQGAVTLEPCRQVIDRHLLVDEPAIGWALRLLCERHGLVVEGAAAVAVAAFWQCRERYRGKTVVIVLCGRNIDPAVLRRSSSDGPASGGAGG